MKTFQDKRVGVYCEKSVSSLLLLLVCLPPLLGNELEQAPIEAAANSLPRKEPFVVLRYQVQQYPLPLACYPENT
jgi:hypothetical protein